MKMSEHDRCMATERSKEFIKDREKVLNLFKKEKPGPVSAETKSHYEQLFYKWHLNPTGSVYFDGIVTPQTAESILAMHKKMSQKNWGIEFGGLSNIETMAQGSVLYKDEGIPRLKTREREPIEVCSPWEVNYTSLEDEDWPRVHWRINLSRPEGELSNDFIKKIKELKRLYADPKRKPERGAKRIGYDKWEIWDLHHKSKLSLLAIARKKTGKDYSRGNKSPAYNDELWSPYGKVETAHSQAEKMIKTVEEEAHRRIRKTKERQKEFQDLRHKIDENVKKFCTSKLNSPT